MTRDAIYQAFYDADVTRGFLHSHSYTGNPLACRAALATLAIFDEDDVLAAQPRPRGAPDGGPGAAGGASAGQAFPPARHDLGLRCADRRSGSFRRKFFSTALEHELLLRPIGRTVYLMPPYILDDDEIDGLAARTQAVFEQVMGGN